MPPIVPFAFTIKILDDQKITNNCRRAQIFILQCGNIDMYRENGCFDHRKLTLISDVFIQQEPMKKQVGA